MISRINDVVSSDKDAGHIELHIIPTTDESQRRVIVGRGGVVHSDEFILIRDLPAYIAKALSGTAVPDNVLAFVRGFFGKNP